MDWKFIASVVVGLGLAATAAAQEPEDSAKIREARARFQVAEAQFEQGNFALAADTFREVYDMMEGHPRRYLVLFNLGRCLEETGAYEQAADAYGSYLSEGGDRGENAAEVRNRVQEMERRAALTGGTAPSAGSNAAPPGQARSAPDDGLLIGALTSYGMALAGFAVMGIFGGFALAEDEALLNGCGATVSCTPAEVADADTFALVSDLGLGAGLVSLAAGTVLLVLALTSSSDEGARASVGVSPIFVTGGAGLNVWGAL